MRASTGGLGDFLFGKARGAVLGLLYERPERSFFYRQLARELRGLSLGSLQRELATLSQFGLIERMTVDRQVFYRANRQHPVFLELRGLLTKTVGTIPLLHSTLAPLMDRISIAFVYGSFAREEEKGESDIDLMIIGKAKLEEVLGRLVSAESSLGRAVNPIVYSGAEFKARLARGNHFLTSVLRSPKIFLVGDEDELKKMGGVRLAQGRTDQSRRD